MEARQVVVTGMGVITSNAQNTVEFAQALRHGTSGIRHFSELEELKFACQVGGQCNIPAERLQAAISEADINSMSQGMKLAALASLEAFQQAGLSPKPEDSDDVYEDTGAMIGTGIGGLDVFAEDVYPKVVAGKVKRLGSSVVERIMFSGPSAKVAGLLGLGNQVSANSSACSTGTEAIIMGAERIRSGLAKRMLVGGVEAAHPQIWAGFDSMRVLSRKFNDTPEQASRPMSASAAGFVPGSGAGILVIEDRESAEQRGAKIYGEILGTSINCGGMRAGGSMTAPSTASVIRCIRSAMMDANLKAHDIDYINGHLTATMADPLELGNWQKALEIDPGQMPWINSTKSLIGHCLGAAGAIESVATLLQLNQGFIHGSINCEDIHPDIAPFAERIVQSTQDKTITTAAKASFGFGDVNSCIIFKHGRC
ncbi:beta-ketoacyl-[acyl-carrier-protein] synthase family protein [Pseudobacteriovorax antillogorgiicola]|uniref:3-oxoacyl-[acyl-carrier-protein] synthase 1 n=1 Tax=Pseudobacteriovorax antillogorgiicola TaxID=1513793 RepID=A0A1Y6BBY4_9BACT|nr:beta-ketoacyl-[acyl-carrier-protein] synthase family protein [Pseudobacteriovorax antillogorgiicola]TCS58680.1 3-oxoacyl-(acyl-carrier-protein) synthase [Pseudobacteriovorax antillogorgiicola]SME95939.1 3-oxoacyl-(acyl-carrier-protein) synthase [Pseudobacteriovorax antillogorgiicola]